MLCVQTVSIELVEITIKTVREDRLGKFGKNQRIRSQGRLEVKIDKWDNLSSGIGNVITPEQICIYFSSHISFWERSPRSATSISGFSSACQYKPLCGHTEPDMDWWSLRELWMKTAASQLHVRPPVDSAVKMWETKLRCRTPPRAFKKWQLPAIQPTVLLAGYFIIIAVFGCSYYLLLAGLFS